MIGDEPEEGNENIREVEIPENIKKRFEEEDEEKMKTTWRLLMESWDMLLCNPWKFGNHRSIKSHLWAQNWRSERCKIMTATGYSGLEETVKWAYGHEYITKKIYPPSHIPQETKLSAREIFIGKIFFGKIWLFENFKFD